MKVFGTELTMVSAMGWILVLHAANHVWAAQSVERAGGVVKGVMVVALVLAAAAFLVAGLALVGKLTLAPSVITVLGIVGGLLSVLLIALTRNSELAMGYAANVLFVSGMVLVQRLAPALAH